MHNHHWLGALRSGGGTGMLFVAASECVNIIEGASFFISTVVCWRKFVALSNSELPCSSYLYLWWQASQSALALQARCMGRTRRCCNDFSKTFSHQKVQLTILKATAEYIPRGSTVGKCCNPNRVPCSSTNMESVELAWQEVKRRQEQKQDYDAAVFFKVSTGLFAPLYVHKCRPNWNCHRKALEAKFLSTLS